MGFLDKAKDKLTGKDKLDDPVDGGDKIADGIDKAADKAVDDKTGGKYADKIDTVPTARTPEARLASTARTTTSAGPAGHRSRPGCA